MAKKDNTTSGGIGFFGLLAIAFIVLKLTNVIDWGWFMVLAPIWLPFVLAFTGVLLYIIVQVVSRRN